MKIKRNDYYIEFDEQTINKIYNEYVNLNNNNRHIMRYDAIVREYLVRNMPPLNEHETKHMYNMIEEAKITFTEDFNTAYVNLKGSTFEYKMNDIMMKYELNTVLNSLPTYHAIDGTINGISIDTDNDETRI